MAATAPAVRRALGAATLAALALAAALYLALSREAPSPLAWIEEPASASEPTRAPVDLEAQAPAPNAETEPAEAAPAPAGPDPGSRRAASEPAPIGTGSLLVVCPLREARLFVGRGGSLPLDALAAPAAAALAGGFLRPCGANPGGGWSVDGLSPGPLRVLVAGPGGQRLELDGLWILAGETLRLFADLERAPGALTLSVLAPDGRGVPGARVALAGDRPGGASDALGLGAASPLGVTGPDGTFPFVPRAGGWRLRVLAPGLALAVLDGESHRDDEPGELALEPGPGAEIHGDLLDPDGLGFAGRTVAAWSPTGPGPLPRALALGVPVDALATVHGATVSPEGRFAFHNLAADAFLQLSALVDGDLAHGDGFADAVFARAGERGVLVTQRAGATLELAVVDRDTLAPIERFSAELAGTWPGGVRSGRDGELVWKRLRPFERAADPTFEDLPESPDLELRLWAEGYDVTTVPGLRLRTGETLRAPRAALRPLPGVHVRVVDARDGAPIAGARCELEALVPELAVGRVASSAVSDADGRARLTSLAGQASELLVRCGGYAPLRVRSPQGPSPDQPLEIALAPGATLRARVLDVERRPVRARVLRRRTALETGDAFAEAYEEALTDAEGWVEFRDLEAGAVALAACELERSDLERAPPVGRMTWVSVGVGQGSANEIELGALAARRIAFGLQWQGEPLHGAVLRLSADAAAFSAPHDDARTFLAGPALRANAAGVVEPGPLHEGVFALRVEHPRIAGFARALFLVGGADGPRTLALDAERLRGEVSLDGERVGEGRVVVWAHGPYYERGMPVEPGSVLRDLVPEPIVLGESELVGGTFDLPVPTGVELIVTAHDAQASGDYYVKVPEGPREAIRVAVEPSIALELAADLRGKTTPTRALGLVGYNRHQPWGRGLIALPLDGARLELGDLPRGRWRLALVELAGGGLVLERGDWSEFDLDQARHGERLFWRRPQQR
jgi:hypothetical protein